MLKEKLKKILGEFLYEDMNYEKVSVNALKSLSKEYKDEEVAKTASEVEGEYIYLTLYLAILGNKNTEKYLRDSISKHLNNKQELFACVLGLVALNPKNKIEIFEEFNITDIDKSIKDNKFLEYLSKHSYEILIRKNLASLSYAIGHVTNETIIYNLKKISIDYSNDREIARLCAEVGMKNDVTMIKYLTIGGNKETLKYLLQALKYSKTLYSKLDIAIGLVCFDIDEGFEILEKILNTPDYQEVYDYLKFIDNLRVNKMKEEILDGKYGTISESESFC